MVCGGPSVVPRESASEAICLSALLRRGLCLWNAVRQSGLLDLGTWLSMGAEDARLWVFAQPLTGPIAL